MQSSTGKGEGKDFRFVDNPGGFGVMRCRFHGFGIEVSRMGSEEENNSEGSSSA